MNLVVNQIVVLFLLLITGYVVRKKEIIDEAFIKKLSDFLLKVTLPALIISSMQGRVLSAELLSDTALLILISICTYIIAILIAMMLPKVMGISYDQIGIYQFLLVFANVGFIGYPLVEAILGKEAIFYAAIFNLPFNFLVYTLGYYYMSKGKSDTEKFTLKKCINPGVIAVFIGFALFILPFKLPIALGRAIEVIGDLTTPLSMIIVGALLIKAKVKDLFSNYRIYIISAYRMIFFPLLIHGLLVVCLDGEINPYVLGVPVVVSALPAAVNAAILAEKYDTSPELASNTIFITTLLSMLTIPLITYLVF